MCVLFKTTERFGETLQGRGKFHDEFNQQMAGTEGYDTVSGKRQEREKIHVWREITT